MNTEVAHTYLKNEVANKPIYPSEMGTQLTSATIKVHKHSAGPDSLRSLNISYDELNQAVITTRKPTYR